MRIYDAFHVAQIAYGRTSSVAGRRMHIGGRQHACGFTLLEVLIAVGIFAIISGVTYFTFAAATNAWRRGVEMTDKIHHAGFAVEQIVMALRSTYYPSTGGDYVYGFWHGDNGSGAGSSDMISWVKLGSSLVGRNASYVGGPHRVKITMEPDEDGEDALMVRAWGLLSEVEDFESDDLTPKRYGMRILGLDCRFEDPESEFEDEIEWIDEWEQTNTIPRAIELTVYMEPLEDDDKPLEIKRFIELPLGESVWGKRKESSIGGQSGGGDEGSDNANKAGGQRAPSAPTTPGGGRTRGSTRLPTTQQTPSNP